MFIETQTTPNPLTLKFLPDHPVTGTHAVAEFATSQEAQGFSGLAEKLFDISGVNGVFLGHDFVSITKTQESSWERLKPEILSELKEYLLSDKPVLEENQEQGGDKERSQEDQEIVSNIKEVLDNYIRPAVAGDGGDIAFRDYKNGVVFLTLRGACSGCPSSQITLKHGVENLLKHYVPQVECVQEMDAA